MAGLIGGMLIPNILRWHWWRLNGTGYACGLFLALLVAAVTGLGSFFAGYFGPDPDRWFLWDLCIRMMQSFDQPEYITAPIIWLASFLGAVGGSLASKPTETDTLVTFYSRVRPFGIWGPVRAAALASGLTPATGPTKSAGRIVLNVGLSLVMLMALYHGFFLLVGHYFLLSAGLLALAAAAGTGLYFSWFRPVLELSDDADSEGS